MKMQRCIQWFNVVTDYSNPPRLYSVYQPRVPHLKFSVVVTTHRCYRIGPYTYRTRNYISASQPPMAFLGHYGCKRVKAQAPPDSSQSAGPHRSAECIFKGRVARYVHDSMNDTCNAMQDLSKREKTWK
jgi:hypothetical protein